MKFRIACTCGKQLDVSSENAGRKGRCPACRTEFIVPTPPGVVSAVAAKSAGMAGASMQKSRPTPPPDPWADLRTVKPSYQPNQSATWQSSSYGRSSSSSGAAMVVAVVASIVVAFLGVLVIGGIYLVPKVLDGVSVSTSNEPSTSVADLMTSESPQKGVAAEMVAVEPIVPSGSSSSVFSPYGNDSDYRASQQKNNTPPEAYGTSAYGDDYAAQSAKSSALQKEAYQSPYGDEYSAQQTTPSSSQREQRSSPYGEGYRDNPNSIPAGINPYGSDTYRPY